MYQLYTQVFRLHSPNIWGECIVQAQPDRINRPTEQPYISLRTAAKRLNLSYRSLLVQKRDGNLPEPRQVGRRWLYPLTALAAKFPEAAGQLAPNA